MVILELRLSNFGAYRGEHKLDLSPTEDGRPIVLLGGMNGAGKTTLLDAITLCLYGPVARTSNRGSKGYETYLRECVNRSATGRTSSVGLRFLEHRDGSLATFDIERSWHTSGGVREGLDVTVDGVSDPLLADNWLEFIEAIIPARIANLFFFDGEKIEGFADAENAKSTLEAALHSLLGLDLMNQLHADLVVLERRKHLGMQTTEAQEELAELQSQINDLQEQRKNLKTTLTSEKNELDQAEKNLKKARTKYQRKGGDFYEQSEQLLARKRQLDADLLAAEDEMRDLASEEAPLCLVAELVEEVVAQGKRERQAKEAEIICSVLSERDARTLKSLEDRLPSDALKEIENKLNADRKAYEKSVQTDVYLELSDAALDSIRATAALLPRTEQEYRKACEKRNRLAEEQARLDERIQAIPPPELILPIIEDCTRWEEQVSQRKAHVSSLSEELETTANRLEQLQNSFDARIEQGVMQEFKQEEGNRVIRFAGHAREKLVELRQRVLEKHLDGIESVILDCFKRLTRKTDLIKKIRICPDSYALTLVAPDGEELGPDRLSAGERQLLAVAMLWGLAKASGVHLPVVIDTPLGRLDGEHRTKLVQNYFPKAGEQVLLLSTDEEIAGKHLNELEPVIGRTYLIEFDEESKSSMINPGYFNGQEVEYAT